MNEEITDTQNTPKDGTSVVSFNVINYLNDNLSAESSLVQCEKFKVQLLKERESILTLIKSISNNQTISQVNKECHETIDQLNQLDVRRNELVKDLKKHTDNSSRIETLCKFTKLINQITRIKKYIQLLLIINILYNKIKLYTDENKLSRVLSPFVNLIEIQHNLHCLKSPSPNNDDHQQPCHHLTKLIDHIIGDVSKILEVKMKEELKTSLKDINWISIGSSSQQSQTSPIGSQPNSMGASPLSQSQQIQKEEEKKKTKMGRFQTSFANLIILQLNTQKYPSTLVTIEGGSSSLNPSKSTSSSTTTTNSSSRKEESLSTSQSKLNTPNTTTTTTTTSSTTSSSTSNLTDDQSPQSNSLWAIDILLEPLIKGFKFHFQTKRVTNIIEKPEWPIHHIRKLIKDHMPFLNTLQSSLIRNEIDYIDVQRWFIGGLIKALNNKFRNDIGRILFKPDQQNRKIFFHTIDELFNLQQFLSEAYDYPTPPGFSISNISQHQQQQLKEKQDEEEEFNNNNNQNNNSGFREEVSPRPTDILEESYIFDRWLQLEVSICSECFDSLISNTMERWSPFYKDDYSELDELKPSYSAHELVDLLKSLCNRFQHLYDRQLCFQFFVKIQLNLLYRYKDELSIMVPSGSDIVSAWKSTLGGDGVGEWDHHQLKEYCYVFNSVYYIIKVLNDWDGQLIYIEIYEYMTMNEKQKQEKLKSNMSQSKSNINVTTTQDDSYSAFSPIISSYKSLGKQMMKKLVEILLGGFTSKMTNYLKKRSISNKNNIFLNTAQQSKTKSNKTDSNTDSTQDNSSSKPSINVNLNSKEESTMDISPEFIDSLSILRYQLSIISRSLCGSKLQSLGRKLSIKLDDYMFKLLIENSFKFSFKDGLQFIKDMKTLFLLFNVFTNEPELYFKKISESCRILGMTSQQLSQFKEEFQQMSDNDTEDQLLQKYDIHNIDIDDLSDLVNIRVE